MSTNLLGGLTLKLVNGTTAESDGTWHHAARTKADGHDDWLVWDLPGQAALATNQTYHVGLSTRGASANDTSLHATIGYKDAAGSINYATSDALAIGTSWGRVEGTIVVPSGMRPFAFYVAAYGVCPEVWMAAPTLSLGSPVTLASDAHTPYATQDHVSTVYATKASLKVTDDSIKAEVSDALTTAKSYTDGSVQREAIARDAAIKAQADSISLSVSKTYTKSETFSAYQSDADSRIATANSNASTAKSTAQTAAADAATAKTNASTAVSTANSASTSAANAVKTANAAGDSAASAVETANSASSTANDASTTASKASTDAAAAVKTANTASSNASTAVTTANGAVTTANAASSTASEAKTTAEGAASTASSAKSVADSASSTAKSASASASNAVSTANAANSTAQTAKSTADTAKSTADAAKSSAATANNTANAAKTAAANAQTSADKAQASADDTAAALAKAAVRIRIDGTPMADGTSQLMAHVYVGNDEVSADNIAKLGTLVWKMDGVADRRGTTTYTAQTGKFVTCRLEA